MRSTVADFLRTNPGRHHLPGPLSRTPRDRPRGTQAGHRRRERRSRRRLDRRASYLLPSPLTRRMSFTTYQRQPRYSRTHVVARAGIDLARDNGDFEELLSLRPHDRPGEQGHRRSVRPDPRRPRHRRVRGSLVAGRGPGRRHGTDPRRLVPGRGRGDDDLARRTGTGQGHTHGRRPVAPHPRRPARADRGRRGRGRDARAAEPGPGRRRPRRSSRSHSLPTPPTVPVRPPYRPASRPAPSPSCWTWPETACRRPPPSRLRTDQGRVHAERAIAEHLPRLPPAVGIAVIDWAVAADVALDEEALYGFGTRVVGPALLAAPDERASQTGPARAGGTASRRSQLSRRRRLRRDRTPGAVLATGLGATLGIGPEHPSPGLRRAAIIAEVRAGMSDPAAGLDLLVDPPPPCAAGTPGDAALGRPSVEL